MYYFKGTLRRKYLTTLKSHLSTNQDSDLTSRPFPACPHHHRAPNIQNCPTRCIISSLSTISKFSHSPPRQILKYATASIKATMFSVFTYRLGVQVSSALVNTEHPRTSACQLGMHTGHQPVAEDGGLGGRPPILLCSGRNIYIHSELHIHQFSKLA